MNGKLIILIDFLHCRSCYVQVFHQRTALRLKFNSLHRNARTIHKPQQGKPKKQKKNLLLAPPNPIVQNKKSSLLVSIFIQTLKARLRSHAHERIHGSADRRTFPSDSPQRVACRRKRAQALPTCGTNLVPPSRASRLTPP